MTTAASKAPAARPASTGISIKVFNPTAWSGPGVVEVPTGSLAAPGTLDWSKVKLVSDGKEIPFALREGTVHWKSKLTAPVKTPHAQDLLVFSCAVPAGKSIDVDVIHGSAKNVPAMAYESGLITVTYPNVKIAIDENTGMLACLKAYGESLLTGKLSANFYKLPGEGYRSWRGISISAPLRTSRWQSRTRCRRPRCSSSRPPPPQR